MSERPRRRGRRAARRWWALWSSMIVAVTACLASAYFAAGRAGLVIAATVLTLLGLLGVRAAMPAGAPRGPVVPEEDRPKEATPADYPAYRNITAELTWAATSRRHYDHGIRPLLAKLTTVRLADRHGVDAISQPGQARELVGEDVWPLVDPASPPSRDRDTPGVNLPALTRIVTKLEEL